MSDEPVTDYETESGVFPADLLLEDRWFVWALDEDRKIPRAPWENPTHTEKYVSWKDEKNWTSFEEADEWVEKVDRFGHASCIPAFDDNTVERIIFFDFDDCRDPETGAIHPHAWALIEKQGLHAAISSSGTGLHGFGWGSLPEGYKPSFEHELDPWEYGDEAELEVYASARFMALTGEHIEGTPVGLPDLGETAHELFEQLGTERTTGTERVPDLTREELADVDKTTDVEDIYDAIAHTYPRDIRLRSSVTQEYTGRDANCARDPSWAQSESGTRLAEFDDHWLYRKGNHRLDALQVVALEEGIIHDETEYPSGDDFRDAVDALRDRGAHIPELVTGDLPALEQGNKPRPSEGNGGEADQQASTDGGAEADGGADADDLPAPDSPSAPSLDDDWDEVYRAYSAADGGEERQAPRFEAASLLAETDHWLNLAENDHLWRYDYEAGVYRDDGEQHAREKLVENLREQFRSHEQNEICEQLRGRFTIPEEELGGPEEHVATQNCVLQLDARAGEIDPVPFDPDYNFITRLETEYDPDAECPRFEQFLQEAVNTDAERKKLQEFAGYVLHHWGLPYHKALFLVGPTASGKSTFLDTIRAMLGEDAVASLTPQQMVSERFGGAELYGSWANIRNDIPASMINNVGQFKEITAGDPMKAEEKYNDPFMFEPNTKHLFSANQLPDAATDDEAFYRRILLVAFPTSVPRDERDPKLDDKLQSELPGVLNWAIEGLLRLLKQGRFTADRTPGETQRTWEKWGSSVDRFASVGFEEAQDEAVPKGEAYRAYVKYCEDESIPAETQHKFTRKLKTEGVEDGREYINGSRERCYLHVELTERAEQYLESEDDGHTPAASKSVEDF